MVYEKNGDYDRAIKCSKKVVSLKPEFAAAHHNLAVIYAKKGDYDNAINCSKKAIHLNPEYADTYFNLGISYARKGDMVRAMKQVARLRELKRTDLAAKLEKIMKHPSQ